MLTKAFKALKTTSIKFLHNLATIDFGEHPDRRAGRKRLEAMNAATQRKEIAGKLITLGQYVRNTYGQEAKTEGQTEQAIAAQKIMQILAPGIRDVSDTKGLIKDLGQAIYWSIEGQTSDDSAPRSVPVSPISSYMKTVTPEPMAKKDDPTFSYTRTGVWKAYKNLFPENAAIIEQEASNYDPLAALEKIDPENNTKPAQYPRPQRTISCAPAY